MRAILMINPRTLLHSLSRTLIFRRLNAAGSMKLANQVDSLRKEFDKSGEIPEKLVKRFVRLNISLAIGIHLADKEIDKWVFDLEENTTLRDLWMEPAKTYLAKRE